MGKIKRWCELSLPNFLEAIGNHDNRPGSHDSQDLLTRLQNRQSEALSSGLEKEYDQALTHLQQLAKQTRNHSS